MKVFYNHILRCIYSRSIFRMITIIAILAFIFICISRIQLFKLESTTSRLDNHREIIDKPDDNSNNDNNNNNQIAINNEQIFTKSPIKIDKLSSIGSNKHSTKSSVTTIPPNKSQNAVKIYSGTEDVKINTSLIVSSDNFVKFVSNDILIKDMNENAKKFDLSLNNKPFDYDKNARFCICSRISEPCRCCVKLAEEVIGLTKSLCANITYIPKHKAARISMRYAKSNRAPIDQYFIDIYRPPAVCLSQLIKLDWKSFKQTFNEDESVLRKRFKPSSVLELCFQTRNLTYSVNTDSSHQTEFKGCSNFYVKLNEMVVKIYPLGCFKAGHESRDLQIPKMNNGIP